MAKSNLEKQTRYLWVFLACFFTLGAAFFWRKANTLPTLKIVKVIDGDTVKLEDGTDIRYIGLDSPELGKGETPSECFAQEAKEINQNLVLGKRVRIETDVNEMDLFGRILAYVYLQPEGEKEIFINEYLLREGIAKFHLDTVNQRYIKTLVSTAELAHEQKKGLWSFCAPNPEVGCQVKGNYDKRGHRFYHLPSFRHYPQVKVNLENGDQWFCTEEEAKTAGFTRARE